MLYLTEGQVTITLYYVLLTAAAHIMSFNGGANNKKRLHCFLERSFLLP